MEKNSLMRHEADWTALRDDAYSRADGAQEPEEVYAALHVAVGALGDGHSQFLEPEEAEQRLETSVSAFDGLEGRPLANRIGYVSLPPVVGSEETLEHYARQGKEAVTRANHGGACGWVVDLRDNTGGNMAPMLAVVAPVLGDGEVGAFVDPDGKKSAWTVRNGIPHFNGQDHTWGPSALVGTGDAPVAVLTSGRTASSGEAITVAFRGRPDTRSFGEPTRGLPTGNESYRLSDGAVLNLTVVKDADRTGRTYDAPIPPDEEILVDRTARGTSADRALASAANWLTKQTACKR
ncbi:S41 family peptidase [Streptomyces sp. MS2.AVA.5]|uniref:S41 family peptidase n=1 Tax=Streptomyces achmelvichensis TaxID=3134111 RepID=A0ACC6PN35_9ACTN